MHKRLIIALHNVIAKDIQQSGNLEAQLRELEEDVRIQLADANHPSSNIKPEEVFQTALDLGREIRQKTVYGIEIDRHWYYFVGTENEIIQKLNEYTPEIDEEVQEAIDKLA